MNSPLLLHERHEMIVSHLSWARHLAKSAMKNFSLVYKNDSDFGKLLISVAYKALVESAENFDSSKKTTFKTFSEYRIRGAILDELREMDPLTRHQRKRNNVFEEAMEKLSQELGRPPSAQEMADAMEMEMEKYHKAAAKSLPVFSISLDEIMKTDSHNGSSRQNIFPDDKRPNAQEMLFEKELSEFFNELLSQLSCKEEMCIKMYYFDEMTESEIASVLDVTESRVSQIIGSVLMRLRNRLKTRDI